MHTYIYIYIKICTYIHTYIHIQSSYRCSCHWDPHPKFSAMQRISVYIHTYIQIHTYTHTHTYIKAHDIMPQHLSPTPSHTIYHYTTMHLAIAHAPKERGAAQRKALHGKHGHTGGKGRTVCWRAFSLRRSSVPPPPGALA